MGNLDRMLKYVQDREDQISGRIDRMPWDDWSTIDILTLSEALATMSKGLKLLADEVNGKATARLPYGKSTLDGFKLEVTRDGSWKDWDGPRLLGAVVMEAVRATPDEPDDNGEVHPPSEQRITEHIVDTLVKVGGMFAPSFSWRIKALKELGIDPERYGRRESGRLRAKVTGTVEEAPAPTEETNTDD